MTSAEPVTFDPRRFLLKNLQEPVYHLVSHWSQGTEKPSAETFHAGLDAVLRFRCLQPHPFSISRCG